MMLFRELSAECVQLLASVLAKAEIAGRGEGFPGRGASAVERERTMSRRVR